MLYGSFCVTVLLYLLHLIYALEPLNALAYRWKTWLAESWFAKHPTSENQPLDYRWTWRNPSNCGWTPRRWGRTTNVQNMSLYEVITASKHQRGHRNLNLNSYFITVGVEKAFFKNKPAWSASPETSRGRERQTRQPLFVCVNEDLVQNCQTCFAKH